MAWQKNHATLVKWILATLAIVALVAASFVWKDYRPFGHIDSPALTNIGLSLQDAEIAGMSKGKKTWKFRAKLVQVGQDRRTATFSDVSSGTIYDAGRPAISLHARDVVYNTRTGNVVARGDVRVKAHDDLSLRTDFVIWNAVNRSLLCPRGVSMDVPSGKAQAATLLADIDNHVLNLGKVSLTLRVPEEPAGGL